MRQRLRTYLSLLRPKHWVKNLFLFAAPFFGGTLFNEQNLQLAILTFITFSLCASAGYIINDIRDADKDRLHPGKKTRPVASGKVTRVAALLLASIVGLSSFMLSYAIAPAFFAYLLAYFIIQILYSVRLKNISIADLFCIASGFVIRVLAGGAAFHSEVSTWLLLTMFMISLVLATGKRLGEVSLLNENIGAHRKSLDTYSIATLTEILLISSSAALISYALYTVEQFTRLVYSVPVVTFGLFRYLLISKRGMGDPTDALTKDPFLALTVALWLIFVGLIRYN